MGEGRDGYQGELSASFTEDVAPEMALGDWERVGCVGTAGAVSKGKHRGRNELM